MWPLEWLRHPLKLIRQVDLLQRKHDLLQRDLYVQTLMTLFLCGLVLSVLLLLARERMHRGSTVSKVATGKEFSFGVVEDLTPIGEESSTESFDRCICCWRQTVEVLHLPCRHLCFCRECWIRQGDAAAPRRQCALCNAATECNLTVRIRGVAA